MKRTLTLALVAIFSICAMAQKPSKEERKAQEKQMIEQFTAKYAEQFGLDSAQTAKFSQIFKDYSKKFREINRFYKVPKVGKDETPTEDQIDAIILAKFDRQRAILEMREFYYRKFRTVLAPSQIKVILDDEKHRKEHMKGHQKPLDKQQMKKEK